MRTGVPQGGATLPAVPEFRGGGGDGVPSSGQMGTVEGAESLRLTSSGAEREEPPWS